MNTKLLRQIQKEIREEPRRLRMSDWIRTDVTGVGAPPCGTVACIAGFATILSHDYETKAPLTFNTKALVCQGGSESYEKEGARALGLTPRQAVTLFYTGQWPARYRNDYVSAHSSKRRAQVTCKRIDAFIRSGGKR